MDEDWTGCDSDLHICVESSSWYSFSLAPLLVNHQLKGKILLFDHLQHSQINFWSSSPRSGRGPSCPSCRAQCCQPRRGTPQQSWHQLRKTYVIHPKSISVVIFSFWHFIGELKIYVGCWIFDGFCYLHSQQSYASHKVFSHENIFHLHLTWVNSTNMAGLRYPSWLR